MDFNYRIGIYGSISTGKSTLINSIFGKHFTRMGILPTTNAVQCYCFDDENKPRLFDEDRVNGIKEKNDDANSRFGLNKEPWNGEPITHSCRSPPDFLPRNENLTYRIDDVPGLNDRTNERFLKWASENFELYDCVILVITIQSGIVSNEEASIVDFIFNKMKSVTYTNLIILVNKCDEMDDDGITILDEELNNMYKLIDDFLTEKRLEYNIDSDRIKIVKYCGKNAYMYRLIQYNTVDYIKLNIQESDLKVIMRDQVGARWNKLDADEKDAEIDKLKNNKVYEDRSYEDNYIRRTGFFNLRDKLQEFTTNPRYISKFYERVVDETLNQINAEKKDECITFVTTIYRLNLRDTEFKKKLIQKVIDCYTSFYKNYVFRRDTQVWFSELRKIQSFEDAVLKTGYFDRESVNYSIPFYTTIRSSYLDVIRKQSQEETDAAANNEIDWKERAEENKEQYIKTVTKNFILTRDKYRNVNIDAYLEDLHDAFIRPSLWDDEVTIQWMTENGFKKIDKFILEYITSSLSSPTPSNLAILYNFIERLRNEPQTETVRNMIVYCDCLKVHIHSRLQFRKLELKEIKNSLSNFNEKCGRFFNFLLTRIN